MADKREGRNSLVYVAGHFPNRVADAASLTAEIAAAPVSQQPTSVKVVSEWAILTFAAALVEADILAIDGVVAAHQGATAVLQKAKDDKNAAIDRKTTSLILSGGFEYPASSGNIFSLSEHAQLNLLGSFSSRSRPGWTYPVVFMTKDNTSSVSLANAADVEAFYDAAVDEVRSIRESGVTLKNQVNAATTKAEVDAIVDSR